MAPLAAHPSRDLETPRAVDFVHQVEVDVDRRSVLVASDCGFHPENFAFPGLPVLVFKPTNRSPCRMIRALGRLTFQYLLKMFGIMETQVALGVAAVFRKHQSDDGVSCWSNIG